jgi:hypothetical protein
MKWLQVISSVALASQMAIHAVPAESDSAQPKTIPPVLRPSEPTDNVVLKLPGAPVAPQRAAAPATFPDPPAPPVPAPAKSSAVAPAPATQPVLAEKMPPPPPKPVETALGREMPKSPVDAESPAAAIRPKPALPAEFARDSALFCQKQIGHWKVSDARSLMGAPLRQRPAYGDDKKTANGRIYAFSDPTGHYKELELDFDKSTGTLRTVFGYPPKLTWKDCQRLWGTQVATADARQGRVFYSYLNRRLDVLVDQQGNVISLGLY